MNKMKIHERSRLEKLWDLIDSEISIIELLPEGSREKINEGLGNLLKLPCILCNDRKCYLVINTEKNIFYCMRCRRSGNSLGFYGLLHQLTINESAHHIIKEYFIGDFIDED